MELGSLIIIITTTTTTIIITIIVIPILIYSYFHFYTKLDPKPLNPIGPQPEAKPNLNTGSSVELL